MPKQTLTNSKPMQKGVRKLEKELGANLITIECPWFTTKGVLVNSRMLPLSWHATGHPVFCQLMHHQHTRPFPQDLPLLTADASIPKMKMHSRPGKPSTIYIELPSTKSLDDPDKGLNDVFIRDLLDLILDCYCHVGKDEINKNMETFMKGSNPSHPLFVYTRKQENCQDSLPMHAWPSPSKPCSPLGPSRPSNAVISPMHGKSGLATLTQIKLGPTGKQIGPKHSWKPGYTTSHWWYLQAPDKFRSWWWTLQKWSAH